MLDGSPLINTVKESTAYRTTIVGDAMSASVKVSTQVIIIMKVYVNILSQINVTLFLYVFNEIFLAPSCS